MIIDLKSLSRRVKEWWGPIIRTPAAQSILKWSRRLFVAGILVYMIYRFSEIGWGNIYHSLPTNPWFYVLYIPLFFSLPFSEIFIYRALWTVSRKRLGTALLVKKVFNHDILGYSGEVFLFWWARQELHLKDGEVMRDIKDNNVISVVVSMLSTLFALLLFLTTTPAVFTKWFHKIPDGQWYFVGISAVILAGLIYRFRKQIFSLSLKTSATIFSIHLIRHVAVFVIQIYQWHVVLPDVPFYVWFTFMALLLVVTRLPFLPNIDLLFLTISYSLSKIIGAPIAGVMAMLAVNSVLDRILHFFIFIYYQTVIRKREAYAKIDRAALASISLQETGESGE